MTRLNSLDLFRGLAIVLVVLSHAAGIFGFDYLGLLGAGRYGVVLFYLVSGYTIYYVLMERDVGKFGISNFLLKRLFRIAPLFYLCLFLAFISTGELSVLPFLFLGFIDVTTFNKILHVEWSIYVEIIFYLLAPVIIKIKKSNQLLLILFFILLSMLWRSLYHVEMEHSDTLKQFYYFNPINFFYSFLIGGYLHQLVRYKTGIKVSVLWIGIICTLTLIIITKFVLKANFYLVGDYLFISLFSLVFLLKAIGFPKLRIRILEVIGTLSYSIYLLHYFILNFINVTLVSYETPVKVIISLFLIYLVSFISHRTIETWGIRIGRVLVK